MPQPISGIKGTAEYVEASGDGSFENPYIPTVYVANPGSSGSGTVVNVSGKYDASWIQIKTFSSTIPDTSNSVPADNEFVSVNFADGIKALEIYAKDLILTNAPTSVVVALWVKVGTSAPYELGTFGATTGENRATVTGNAGFSALSPILLDLYQKNATDIKVACRVIVDGTRITYVIDSNAKLATQATALGANTGFLDTLCLTNSNSTGSPAGIGGSISFYNPTTNAITIENANFITGESLRLPWGNTPNNYFPPLGLSGKVVCSDIDRITNRITINGSKIDFRLFSNRLVRFRLSSIFSLISVFPNVDNAVLSSATSYYLLNVSGNIGNQTAQISTNGITPLTFTSQGAGWIYVFPYRDIDGVSIDNSSRLTIDNNLITYTSDWNDQPVIVSTVGTASVVTHTGHGFSNGEAVRIAGLTVPPPANAGDVFYVIFVSADSYKLSAVNGGLPVAFTGSGSSVTIQRVSTSAISAVSVSTGTPSVITFGFSTTTTIPHWMGAFQRIILGGTTRPGAAYNYNNLWLSTTSLTAASFQVVQLIGSPSVAFETAGTGVTLTALLRYGNMLIERATVIVGANGDTDSTFTIKDSAGSILSITGLHTATTTIQPINNPIIISGSIQVRPVGGV